MTVRISDQAGYKPNSYGEIDKLAKPERTAAWKNQALRALSMCPT
jgi:hypothetical protein